MKYGRYEVIDEIGKGAMGVVYRAYDPQIDRQVALKILHEARVTDEKTVLRFLREAQAMGSLSHPNIATIYDSGWDHDQIFIAMELLKGKSLEDLMQERRLAEQEIVRIGVQVAEALDFVHRREIVHRDIKPSNIIIDPEGQVKITDFGIAHIEDPVMTQELAKQTLPGEILGTPLYMSPEQVMGKQVDGRSDLYSLGVILYELTTGANAANGETIFAIYQSIIKDTPPAPKRAGTPVAQSLSKLIMKSLNKDPAKRFQTGRKMAQPLKTCLQRRKSDTLRERGSRDKSKRMLLMLLIAAMLIVAVVATVYLISNNSGESKQAPLARLKVDSEPAGANLFLNGSLKGQTPLEIDLPLGKYEIHLSLENYYEWEAQVQLDEPGEIPLFVEMVPMEKE